MPATLNPGDMIPISTDLAESKGLASNGQLNDDYATVQNMYRAILLPRLVQELDLAPYDQELAQDGIVATTGDSTPFYLYAQQCAGLPLDYFFFRNNVYVERLGQAQIDAFLAHANDPQFTTDQELIQIVTDTYPRIIRQDDEDGNFQTGFDTSSRRFYNDAIVIWLTTSISPDEMDNGRYTDLHKQRVALITDVVDRLEASLADVPGHVSLFWA